ncbi:hypothetical protein SADUNF_Sadunf06G0182200 [Salix dunnii]|uniref:Uncharacterized protein n=1 Tax=Salix dunnii TaxID=1413687 RepID=A0A835MXL5_9ROSI|nr:hypothetical protein SADUNF_Sadunf06G0182200 [Salix dunnii]
MISRSFVESMYHKAIGGLASPSHQFFEGSALGGCISRAPGSFFAITNPEGTAIASFYNPNSPGVLAAEAGILVSRALLLLIFLQSWSGVKETSRLPGGGPNTRRRQGADLTFLRGSV